MNSEVMEFSESCLPFSARNDMRHTKAPRDMFSSVI